MPQKLTREEFIKRSNKIHGNKYDYSRTEYINSDKKVCIICPIHGEFWQRAADHMLGRGCDKCGGSATMNTDDFIKKAQAKYGNKYDYSKVEYTGNKNKVCIICHEKDKYGNEHGEFWQTANDHLNNYGCPKCGKCYKPSTEEWVERAKLIHGNKYDYSESVYKNSHTKIKIICHEKDKNGNEHGEFLQTPYNHINGNGCPYCNSGKKSKMEENIRLRLEEEKIKFEQQKTFDWLKYVGHLFLDFYCDEYKIAIEVQGEQHFIPVNRYGGQDDFMVRQKRDQVKKELCEEHGIKVFYITKRNKTLNEVLQYINEASNKK